MFSGLGVKFALNGHVVETEAFVQRSLRSPENSKNVCFGFFSVLYGYSNYLFVKETSN